MILDDLLKVAEAPTKAEKADLIDEIVAKGGATILKMIFDDMFKFNIAVVRLPDFRFYNPELEVPENQELEDLLEKLASRKLTGNNALVACANFGNRLNDEYYNLFCDILQSNPRLGIDATGLNKRCDLFKIPQFKVHLCKSLKDVKSKIDPSKEWVVQPKIDGNRIVGIKDPLTKLYSRKGHARESLEHIVAILDKFEGECVFDGEVEYRDSLEATGAIRRKKQQAKEAIYTIFGIYDINQWKSENHTDHYIKVYTKARNFVDALSEEDKCFVRVIPSFYLGSFPERENLIDAVSGYYEQFLTEGYEGVVFKTLSHIYLPSSGSRRSMETIKNKPWIDADVTVIGFNESKTNPDTFGSFQCIDRDQVELDPSPGNIKKDELNYIWHHQDKFLHKTLEIKYQGKTEYGFYRHPNAVKFRDDV